MSTNGTYQAVMIVVFRGSDVLMIKNRKRGGSIEIPAGSLLEGESVLKGAQRELREETGLTASEMTLCYAKQGRKPWTRHYRTGVVLGRYDGTCELTAGDDAEEAFFGDPTRLLEGKHAEDYVLVRSLQESDVREKFVSGDWDYSPTE